MSNIPTIPRSPELMNAGDTALVVVDVQTRLLPAITGSARIAWNIGRLVDGATLLAIPIAATEQFPQGLGPTVPELASRIPGPISAKMTFSACGCPELFDALRHRGVHKLLVCGIEAHVCIQQTVFDLLGEGWRVYVPVDAVGSRFEVDCRTALERMDSAGAVLTTTEAALFEWCATADAPAFKQISRLVRLVFCEAS